MKAHKILPAHPGQLLAAAGKGIALPCGGRRHCGNCAVFVRGALAPPGAKEQALLQKYTQPPPAGYTRRLACFCALEGEAELLLPEGAIATFKEDAAPPVAGEGSCGLAVDIGTTTIALEVHRPGQPVAAVHEINRQTAFGADVLSRIAASSQNQHNCVQAQLRDMLARTGVAPAQITHAVTTGNTVMLHLFAGLSPKGMGAFPFKPESNFGKTQAIAWLPNAEVYLPPCPSAFVGGDIACGALAAGLLRGSQAALLVDVGTNGEMLLRTPAGTLACCSVAAGPAFEGAEISMGMPALPGAIDWVRAEGGALRWHCLGEAGQKPVGLCGTGLISALLAFAALGAVDAAGTIVEEEDVPWLLWQAEGPALWLPGTDVTITQQDVRKLQTAKAAVRAGIETLLHTTGTRPEDVAVLHLAGGFGSFLRPKDAAALGMLPQDLAARAIAGGNLALRGAAQLLFDLSLRKTLEHRMADVTEIQLADSAFFAKSFLQALRRLTAE
ncbi:MAG: ASKHA domain-containing protein [Oscillospiraceae bacterium]|nr:ASKHA domain-containing protein [Oscillospiraceae bacterium]